MIYILLTLIALSNLFWLYAWLASAHPFSVNWIVALLGPDGAEPQMFVASAIVLALALQISLSAFLLWMNTRKKHLASKYHKVRGENREMSSENKEREKKIQQQEHELEEAHDIEARAKILSAQNSDLESFNTELKNQNVTLQDENDKLSSKITDLEKQLSGEKKPFMQRLKDLF